MDGGLEALEMRAPRSRSKRFMPHGLFKYFPTDGDRLERFANGQVYLTPPIFFNDPWDFSPQTEPPTAEQLRKAAPFLDPKDVPQVQRNTSRLEFLEGGASALQRGLSKIAGVVCLTQNPLDRLMWAHYGECHRGFVAEFRCSDDEKTTDEGSSVCGTVFGAAAKVRYQPQLPTLKAESANIEEILVTKHSEWTYEQEWRVIRPLATGHEHPVRKGFVVVFFRPIDLLRVILGLEVSPAVDFRLRQMLNHNEFGHVRIEQAYIDPESRQLKSRASAW